MDQEDRYICPRCGFGYHYRYGHTRHGKQRHICLGCGYQFSEGNNGPQELQPAASRPVCSKCGQKMHIYKRDVNSITYRCSQYPDCRTYLKLNRK